MMRLRSSVRCSKNVMVPPGSSVRPESCELGAESVTGSHGVLRVLGRLLYIRAFGFRAVPRGAFGVAWYGFGDGGDDWSFANWRFHRRLARRSFSPRRRRKCGGLTRLSRSATGGHHFRSLISLGQQGLPLQVAHLL